MKWTLYDEDWQPVAEVDLPGEPDDDVEMPFVVIWQSRTFYYDERSGEFIETIPHIVAP